jgi:hypothetical protein
MPSKQLKVMISEETALKLEAVRREFGYRTTTKIAAEVVEQCLELWKEAQAARERKVAKQYAKMRKLLDRGDVDLDSLLPRTKRPRVARTRQSRVTAAPTARRRQSTKGRGVVK